MDDKKYSMHGKTVGGKCVTTHGEIIPRSDGSILRGEVKEFSTVDTVVRDKRDVSKKLYLTDSQSHFEPETGHREVIDGLPSTTDHTNRFRSIPGRLEDVSDQYQVTEVDNPSKPGEIVSFVDPVEENE